MLATVCAATNAVLSDVAVVNRQAVAGDAHMPLRLRRLRLDGLELAGGTNMRKLAIATVTAVCLFGGISFTTLAASPFEGVWKVKDTAGKPFEITLSSDGIAKATRGEGMTGTWKEEGDSAVITWNTGWTTKITKQGNQYIKAAYRKGQSLTAAPANTSTAEKAE